MDQARTCQTRRTFTQAPAEVFAAMAEPRRLARWWGPAGFRNRFEVCDVRPGGAWVFTMIGPDGTAYANRCEFTEVVPAQRLVVRHVVAPLFTLTIELAPQAGGTVLAWTQVFDDAATAQAVRAIVEPANEQNLDRLAGELARPAGDRALEAADRS